MTEAEWLAATDPTPMLEFLRDKASDRKLRLFAVACVLSVSDPINDDRSLRAITTAELLADGLVSNEDRERYAVAAHSAMATACLTHGPDSILAEVSGAAFYLLAKSASRASARAILGGQTSAELDRVTQKKRALMLVDIFGNPFRPVAFCPSWRTDTALPLAQQMYDSHDFGAMPILADALQDAGCDSDDILNHCLDDNATHVRGCWVVDLVLGKE